MSRASARCFILSRLARPFAWCRRKPQRPRRILVLHHLLLGDTLMLTPLLARIAARYPEAERFLACPAAIAPLFATQPYGFTALPWQPRRGDIATLRAHAPYDLVVIPAENRHSPLARVLGRHVLGFGGDRPGWKNFFLDESRPFPERAAAFGDFCADLIDGPAQSYCRDDWPLPAATAFDAPRGAYAVLHLGASSPLKYWPAERWTALADWLARQGIEAVWSAGAKETALVGAVDPAGRYRSFAGTLDLAQLARLFAGARLIVCPDTGVAHLARIVGTPTVALFGPGSSLVSGAGEFWRDSPFSALSVAIDCRDQDVTFRRHAAWIRRCARSFGDGAGQCPRPRCMEGIALEAVQAACAAHLAPQS